MAKTTVCKGNACSGQGCAKATPSQKVLGKMLEPEGCIGCCPGIGSKLIQIGTVASAMSAHASLRSKGATVTFHTFLGASVVEEKVSCENCPNSTAAAPEQKADPEEEKGSGCSDDSKKNSEKKNPPGMGDNFSPNLPGDFPDTDLGMRTQEEKAAREERIKNGQEHPLYPNLPCPHIPSENRP